jgi:tRNA threonylcarbamoyladenosine biosynthesis protein TsaB
VNHITSKLLAFDTSTEHLSIAVTAHGDEVHTFEGPGGAAASSTLIPSITALLRTSGIKLIDLDAIAFGCGPGAFTGLRTACSVAQGLALGLNKPVLAIDTLLTVAENARSGAAYKGATHGKAAQSLRTWVVMDARMGEIYAAQYQFVQNGWVVLDAPMLTAPEALNQCWQTQAPECVAGNALIVFGNRLVTGNAVCVPNALPSAAAMLPLAQTLWQQGGAVDAALALPVYLRNKVAQTTDERAAEKIAKNSVESGTNTVQATS